MDENNTASPDIEVLIVDDEEGIRGVLNDMMLYFGYKPMAYASAEEALDDFQNHNFRLALIDVILPGISGLVLAEKLHKIKPETLIFLTGGYDKYIEPEDMEKLGVKGFISKPFKMSEMRNILHDLL